MLSKNTYILICTIGRQPLSFDLRQCCHCQISSRLSINMCMHPSYCCHLVAAVSYSHFCLRISEKTPVLSVLGTCPFSIKNYFNWTSWKASCVFLVVCTCTLWINHWSLTVIWWETRDTFKVASMKLSEHV